MMEGGKRPVSTDEDESSDVISSPVVSSSCGPKTESPPKESKNYVSTLMVLLMKSSKGGDQRKRKESMPVSVIKNPKLMKMESVEVPSESIQNGDSAAKDYSCNNAGDKKG